MSLSGQLKFIEDSGLIRLALTHPELEYLFRHALLQEAAYDSLLKANRRTLHLVIGETLERLYPDRLDELSNQLAHHFYAAGSRSKAIQYARHAARRAESAYAYPEAIHYLRRALTLLQPNEQTEIRLALLEELADNLPLLGEHPQAITLYQQAVDVWHGLPDADKWIAVRLHRKIGETFLRIKSQTNVERFALIAHSSLEHALSLIEGEPPQAESVRVLSTLANDKWNVRAQQDWESAEYYARAAVAMGEQLDAPVELSAALGALDTVYGVRGLYRERVQLSQRQLALSSDPRFNDLRKRVSLLCQTGNALLFVGDYARAIPHLLEATHLANQIRDVSQHIYALGLQAQCFFGLDRWDEMLEIESKRLALEEEYGRDRVDRMCFYCGLSANVYALRGEFAQSHARRDEAYTMMAVLCDGPAETWPQIVHY